MVQSTSASSKMGRSRGQGSGCGRTDQLTKENGSWVKSMGMARCITGMGIFTKVSGSKTRGTGSASGTLFPRNSAILESLGTIGLMASARYNYQMGVCMMDK